MDGAPGLSLRRVSPWRRMWRPFWALPAAIMLGSVALGILVPVLDQHLLPSVPWVFSGRPDGARNVLSTVSSAMISVTGLVFSVTMVVLQLASSQFTPRVIGNFLDARVAQVTLGVFAGSFLYSLTVLRVVRDDSADGPAIVPHTAVTLSYLYVLASVAMFLAFIAHITSMVQVSRVISDLGHGTVEGLRANDTEEHEPAEEVEGDGVALRLDRRHGHVVAIDAGAIVDRAAEWDVVVCLEVGIGDFVVPEQVVGEVRGGAVGPLEDEQLEELARCLSLERERALPLDPLFGTRQLVDIAERALSPGINDPTTATQVVNELHVVLRVLSTRPDPAPYVRDDAGRVRLTYRTQDLALAVDELMLYAAEAAQVPEAVASMLDELGQHAIPEHHDEIERARARVSAARGHHD